MDESVAAEKPSVGPSRLMSLAQEFFISFEPAKFTLDTHLDACIGSKLKNGHPDDETFIRQIIYGTFRYGKLIRALLKSFFHHNSGTALRKDSVMYMLNSYIALIRIEELPFDQFRALVMSQDPQKMLVLLQYLFNRELMHSYVREDWLKDYDKTFVDRLLEKLQRKAEESRELMKHLMHVVYLNDQKTEPSTSADASAAPAARRSTVPKPFKLTKLRPKPLPHAEPPVPAPKSKKPPPRRDGPTKEERAIEAAKAMQRKKMAAVYSDPRVQPFKLATLERPTNLERIREEVAAQREAERGSNSGGVRPVPPAPDAEVRLNATAILREDALYMKKQQQEAELLRRYEQELRDATEFLEWQRGMLAADDAAKQAVIAQRKEDVERTHQQALFKRSQKVKDNLQEGRKLKQERQRVEEARRQELAMQREANQVQREAIVAERVRIERAAERVRAGRKERAAELRAREAEHAAQMASERAAEDAARKDIIRQLRAQEKAPRKPTDNYDPTEVVDHGRLEQMSLVELRKRLEVVRRRQKEEEEQTRMEILRRKTVRTERLLKKGANISRIRKLAHAQAEARRAAKVAAAEQREMERGAALEERTLCLAEKLDAKRAAAAAERARLAAEEKRVVFEQQQQSASAAVVEENKFLELRAGARRELIDRQQSALAQKSVYEQTKARVQAVRLSNVRRGQKQTRDFLRSYDEKLRKLRSEHEAAMSSDQRRRRTMAEKQRSWEAQQHTMHEAQAYKPFSGESTSAKARLDALGQGIAV